MPNPIGLLLRRVRAGQQKLVWSDPGTQAPTNFRLTSTSFDDGAAIPTRHANVRAGQNVSPELTWSTPPPGTVELVLVAEDPDAPLPTPIVHALIAGIDPAAGHLAEGTMGGAVGAPGENGKMIRGKVIGRDRGYTGPRPIPSHGPHTYVFQLYAVDRPSHLSPDFTRKSTLAALGGHVIGRARLDGTYTIP